MRDSTRHPFSLNGDDRIVLNRLLNFLKAVSDPYIRGQVRDTVIETLQVMVRIPSAAVYVNATLPAIPIFYSGILSLAAGIYREPTVHRLVAYLLTVANYMED